MVSEERCLGGCEEYLKHLGKEPNEQPGCCTSCHTDDDLGYPMLEVDVEGGYYYVCCRVAQEEK
ncbi:MAG: hypothetical protein ACXABY_14045 [Candidatus Thorarchaeota archaeon]|jgi:hypothetical protein